MEAAFVLDESGLLYFIRKSLRHDVAKSGREYIWIQM